MTAKYDAESLNWTRFSDYMIADGLRGRAAARRLAQYNPWSGHRVHARIRQATASAGRKPGRCSLHGAGAPRPDSGAGGQRHHRAELRSRRGAPNRNIEVCPGAPAARRVPPLRHKGRWPGPRARLGPARGAVVGRRVWALREARSVRYAPARGRDDAASSSFDDVAGRFFCGEMPTPLPHPVSVDFLQNYGESVFDFVIAASTFRDAATDALSGDTESLDVLRAGIFTKTKVVRDRRGKVLQVEDEVVFPSLIHAFAEQVARDLKGGFRLMTCSGCGGLLRTNYHRTLYCSEQCRWKVVRRNQRHEAAGRNAKAGRGAK